MEAFTVLHSKNWFVMFSAKIKSTIGTLVACWYSYLLLQGLIAGGTFVGDVYVWDLAQDGDFQIFKSTLSASSHQ